MSTTMAGIDTRLTATPDFASGVNQRRRAEWENAWVFAAQVDASLENLSTRRKGLVGKELGRTTAENWS
jgi:hypothetical protein